MRAPKIMVVAVLALFAVCSLAVAPQETENLKDLVQINDDGFGSKANKYAFSMATFKDSLYVGTLNIKNMAGMFNFLTSLGTRGWSNGAEIWRYGKDGTWTRVVSGGLTTQDNLGVRKMAVIKDCLWAVTANHNSGMEVWKTCDGTNWEAVVTGGFGDKHNTSGRGLGGFKDYIFVGVENRAHGAQLWRSDNGKDWVRIDDQGIHDKNNVWFSDFAEFKGQLYSGTLNIRKGCEVFRTRDGLHFERVAARGFEKKSNFAAMKLITFRDNLFVSTMDFLKGADIYMTSDGVNFERVMEYGFNTKHNAYMWQMHEYNGRLYVGSYDHHIPPNGAFTLLSSTDGKEWRMESDTGFDNHWYYGVRSMEVFDNRLIIGSASARFGTKIFAAQAK